MNGPCRVARIALAAVGLGLAGTPSLHAIVIIPTTTVAIETSNNTSTSNDFPGTASQNGNEGPSNISKVDTRTLLYSNSQTRAFVHLEPWFCLPQSDHCSCSRGNDGVERCNGHVLTGYNSNDQNQVHLQVNDMLSRGVQGLIIDWYGQNDYIENETSKKVRIEAERHSPSAFSFILMNDGGQYSSCQGDTHCIEQGEIADLTYAANTFVPSPNYAKAPNGDPYVLFFHPYDGSGNDPAINWDTVWNGVSQYHYQFVFENAGGFTHSHSEGAYAWVQPTQNPEDDHWATYLQGFYTTAKRDVQNNPSLNTFAANFKGFNDALASWGDNRIIDQHCGQVWLKTFQIINQNYSAAIPLENLQGVTWNDYDEGSELESGIDNCVSLTPQFNSQSNVLSWNVAGDTSTLDHYTVFASSDDFDLMVLQDNIPASTFSLNVGSFQLPGATYLRVKVVGKPSLLNHLSSSVQTGINNNPVPILSSILPSSATVGSSGFTLTATGMDFVPLSWVKWNGASLTSNALSSTTLTAIVPAADLASVGVASVTVFSPAPGGGTSNILLFSVLSTTETQQNLPAPQVILPEDDVLPVNGTIDVNYNYPNVTFSWTFSPGGSNFSLPDDKAPGSDNGTIRFQSGSHQVQLALYPFLPGAYSGSVTASDSQGDVSPPATFNVILVAGDLSGVRVYPNPWNVRLHSGANVTFSGLTGESTVKLFTVSGHIVKVLPPAAGSASWDLTNDSGDKVASGLYLYLITTNQGQKKTGTLAVIR